MVVLEKKLNISAFSYFLYKTWKFAGLSEPRVLCTVTSNKGRLETQQQRFINADFKFFALYFSLCTLLNPFEKEFKVKIIIRGQNI